MLQKFKDKCVSVKIKSKLDLAGLRSFIHFFILSDLFSSSSPEVNAVLSNLAISLSTRRLFVVNYKVRNVLSEFYAQIHLDIDFKLQSSDLNYSIRFCDPWGVQFTELFFTDGRCLQWFNRVITHIKISGRLHRRNSDPLHHSSRLFYDMLDSLGRLKGLQCEPRSLKFLPSLLLVDELRLCPTYHNFSKWFFRAETIKLRPYQLIRLKPCRVSRAAVRHVIFFGLRLKNELTGLQAILKYPRCLTLFADCKRITIQDLPEFSEEFASFALIIFECAKKRPEIQFQLDVEEDPDYAKASNLEFFHGFQHTEEKIVYPNPEKREGTPMCLRRDNVLVSFQQNMFD